MIRKISILILGLTIALLVATCVYYPSYLSDHKNLFLKEFVGQNFLSFLGVIVTITLASAANLHLELNKLTDAHEEDFLQARSAIKAYSYLLICLFALAFILVFLKSFFLESEQWTAIFNSLSIIIVFINILSLADLAMAMFAVPPNKKIGNGT